MTTVVARAVAIPEADLAQDPWAHAREPARSASSRDGGESDRLGVFYRWSGTGTRPAHWGASADGERGLEETTRMIRALVVGVL